MASPRTASHQRWHTRCMRHVHVPRTVCCLQGALCDAGVTILGGPRASEQLKLPPAPGPRVEYGCNTLTLELVPSLDEAIDHIHAHGSGHTEAIVTGARRVQSGVTPLCRLVLQERGGVYDFVSPPQRVYSCRPVQLWPRRVWGGSNGGFTRALGRNSWPQACTLLVCHQKHVWMCMAGTLHPFASTAEGRVMASRTSTL